MTTTNIFKDGVLVDVNVSFWSASKVLKAEDLGLDETRVADAYKLGKKMLLPERIIREFRSIEGKARRVVEENSFKFPVGSARFVPKRKFPKVLSTLQEYQDQYDGKIESLISEYSNYREEMIPVYKQAAEQAFLTQMPTGVQEFSLEDQASQLSEFTEKFLVRINSYYPPADSLMERFSLSWDVYEVAMPRMRKGSSAVIADSENKLQVANQEYQEQMKVKIGGFIGEVVTALRQETVEVCTRVANNITEGKVITGRSLGSLRNFIDKFSELNFVGDQKIEDQLAQLRKDFLEVHSHEQISDQVELKDELKQRLNVLADAAGDLTDINSITGEYKRKIDWDENV